ncbi:MAG: LuxR C-terminal-related transcriptional regulator [Thermoanaerobaculia bacterium]
MPQSGGGRSSTDDALALGRAALAKGAWEEARVAFQGAVAHERAAEALEGLGWALWWLDRVEESLEAREKAYALHAKSGDRRRAARVAIHLAVDAADVRGPAPARGWLERAQSLLAPHPDAPELGWLELWRGHVLLLFDDDPVSARRSAARAGEIARASALPDLELLARALDGLVLVREGEVADGMRRLDEATAAALSGEIGDLDVITTACCFMVYACEHVRDYDRASQWQGRVDSLSRAWSIRDPLAACRIQNAKLLLWQGRWGEAEAHLAQAMETAGASRPANAREAAAVLGELRRRQGRTAEAEALFLKAEGLSAGFLGLASLALDGGDPRTAVGHLDRASRRVGAADLAVRTAVLDRLVEASLRFGETDRARETCAELESLAERARTPALLAVARVARGRLALAGRSWGEAVRELEDAVDLYVASGAAWETATARLLLSEALRRAGRDDRAEAEAARARESLAALGAVEPGRRPAGGSRATGPALTPREREVLRLVGEGLGDRAIAERLGLSTHTVHRHVANLLGKLGCSSRAAAVRQASRAGLL